MNGFSCEFISQLEEINFLEPNCNLYDALYNITRKLVNFVTYSSVRSPVLQECGNVQEEEKTFKSTLQNKLKFS
jgi:hypothetical protein